MPNSNKINNILTQYNVLLGDANNNISNVAPTSAQNILSSNGVSANPSFANTSTANYTFGGSASGVTRTLTIANTSNTVSSDAKQTITVSDAAAGDASTNYKITGIRDFTQGFDNSDADSYKIAISTALGTTDAFVATTAGEITTPLQSTCLAYKSANQPNAFGASGTFPTLIYNVEIFDLNSDYNPATGVFTAPVTGRYLLTFAVRISNMNINHQFVTGNFITSNRFIMNVNIKPFPAGNAANQITAHSSMIADLDAADTVSTNLASAGSTNTIQIDGDASMITFFAVRLVA